MGLALHDDKTSKVFGQLARVLEFVSLDVMNLFKVNIRLGGTGWFWKNKSTRRAAPCFSLKMHEPAGSSHLDTRNSMVLLQLQHPGWTCRTKVSAQRLTLPLSLDKSFGEYFYGQGLHLTRLIGWTSCLVNTRFYEPRHFSSTRNKPSHNP
jgi:hypothetical protein